MQNCLNGVLIQIGWHLMRRRRRPRISATGADQFVQPSLPPPKQSGQSKGLATGFLPRDPWKPLGPLWLPESKSRHPEMAFVAWLPAAHTHALNPCTSWESDFQKSDTVVFNSGHFGRVLESSIQLPLVVTREQEIGLWKQLTILRVHHSLRMSVESEVTLFRWKRRSNLCRNG